MNCRRFTCFPQNRGPHRILSKIAYRGQGGLWPTLQGTGRPTERWVIVLRFVPREWGTWQAPVFRHAILCGQHSLEIFCTGVFLSFGAHIILYEGTHGVFAEIVVSGSGIVLMVGLASLMAWYQNLEAARHDSSLAVAV
jgi:hypothetical protein